MKLTSYLLVAGTLASLASAQATFPRTPGAGILYSAHNFFNSTTWNAAGPNTKNNEVCGVCHIPHVEGRPADRTNTTPLWGRQMSTATYTMYSSPTMQGTVDPQPTGNSRLCLSCHDGTVAFEMFHTGTTGTSQFSATSSRRQNPGEFGSMHPVSVTYPATRHGLLPVTSPFGPANRPISDFLEGGKVQCATCHDIHNIDVPTGVYNDPLSTTTPPGTRSLMGAYLRMSVSDPANPSAICFACHAK